MLRTDRICAWIFIGAFALLVPSVCLLKFTDELTVLLLMGVVSLDCIVNNNWGKYKGLWIVFGIMAFYALYSLLFMHFNTPTAILLDMLIQMKPFIPFFVFIALGTSFTALDKGAMKCIAVANCLIVGIITIFFRESLDSLIQHISYVGIICFVSSIIFIFCSIEADGKIKKTDIWWGLGLMCIGLLGTRAKFFGTFIIAIYFLLIYKPGLSKQSILKLSIASALVLASVIIVAWYKFEYYFITGNGGRFDPEVIEAFARPIMYATGSLILLDFIPFGSGLASFASYASGEYHYSSLYHDYGINNIVGLSKQDPSCICDAFYPSLAQFGFVGIGMFIYFWIYIAKKLKSILRKNPSNHRIYFAIGWTIIIFILIESVASTTFVQSGGQVAMMALGAICHLAYASKATGDETASTPLPVYSFLNTPNLCQTQTR